MIIPSQLSAEAIRAELLRLRQGPSLGHPGIVTTLSDPLRALLLARQPPLSPGANETTRLVAALRRVIDALTPLERRYAVADFNLLADGSWPTLTDRQESLARALGCSAKTVRRHAGQALDTLARLICDGSYLTEDLQRTDGDTPPIAGSHAAPPRWPGQFLGITATSRVDVICSDLPETDRARQRLTDPLYARYAGFADIDALFYVRLHLARRFPEATVRDFHPAEYYNAEPDCLILLGSPVRNAAYGEFGPHLPYRFTQFPDAAITFFFDHGNLTLVPQRAPGGELVADLAVITRLTLDQGTTVILLGGCLTLGVLGAAKCLLNGERGHENAMYLDGISAGHDFVAVTAIRKIGGITDTPDLVANEPLLVLIRDHPGAYNAYLDNSDRYPGPTTTNSF